MLWLLITVHWLSNVCKWNLFISCKTHTNTTKKLSIFLITRGLVTWIWKLCVIHSHSLSTFQPPSSSLCVWMLFVKRTVRTRIFANQSDFPFLIIFYREQKREDKKQHTQFEIELLSQCHIYFCSEKFFYSISIHTFLWKSFQVPLQKERKKAQKLDNISSATININNIVVQHRKKCIYIRYEPT